jgi:hypothetical protein
MEEKLVSVHSSDTALFVCGALVDIGPLVRPKQKPIKDPGISISISIHPSAHQT